jgi:hypothetical protein
MAPSNGSYNTAKYYSSNDISIWFCRDAPIHLLSICAQIIQLHQHNIVIHDDTSVLSAVLASELQLLAPVLSASNNSSITIFLPIESTGTVSDTRDLQP